MIFVTFYYPAILIYTRNPESKTEGGEIDIGGVDPSHYQGDIFFTPVIKKGYWQIQVDS